MDKMDKNWRFGDMYALSFQVQKDIYDQLKLKVPVAAFKVSCFRSNLFYDVVFIDTMDAGDPLNDLIEFMQCGAITDGVEVYGVC